MKKWLLLLLPLPAMGQDSSGKEPAFTFSAGLDISTTPVFAIVKKDTSFVNELSLSPVLDLQHRSGLGIRYAPSFVASGAHTGLQYQQLSAYYEQYRDGNWDIDLSYTRFIFRSNKFYPESPINNQLYGMVGYKKNWVEPAISVAYGFGKNMDGSNAFDASLSAGAGHTFSGEDSVRKKSWSFTPSLSLNAGTNNNYSFLSNAKYISRSKRAATKIQSRKHPTTSTSVAASAFDLRNLEAAVYASWQWKKFELVPAGSLYFPLNATDTFDGYWQLGLRFHF